MIPKRAKDCYKNNKEVLRERAKNKYSELPDEQKNIKREHRKNRYLNMSKEYQQRLKEYQRNYRRSRQAT